MLCWGNLSRHLITNLWLSPMGCCWCQLMFCLPHLWHALQHTASCLHVEPMNIEAGHVAPALIWEFRLFVVVCVRSIRQCASMDMLAHKVQDHQYTKSAMYNLFFLFSLASRTGTCHCTCLYFIHNIFYKDNRTTAAWQHHLLCAMPLHPPLTLCLSCPNLAPVAGPPVTPVVPSSERPWVPQTLTYLGSK